MKVQSLNSIKESILSFFDSSEMKESFEDFLKKNESVSRFEIPLPPIAPLNWICQQSQDFKMYGSDRENRYEIAGVGLLEKLDSDSFSRFEELYQVLQEILQASNEQIKFYGGISFDPKSERSLEWDSFKKFQFVIPAFEVFQKNSHCFFACNFKASQFSSYSSFLNYLKKELELLSFENTNNVSLTNLPKIQASQETPQKEMWDEKIQTALDQMKEGQFQKVVLARRKSFQLDAEVNAFELLSKLKPAGEQSFAFCFQTKEGKSFIGTTPELLYRRSGRLIASEAIAGTRSRGKDESEDANLEKELMESDKDIREHQIACEKIQESLQSLCVGLELKKDRDVLKLRFLQHLYSCFVGQLKEGVDDAMILNALQPTPAVLGEPKKEAMYFLKQHEDLDRGWYAGPMGWIGKDEATFVVGIRSGLLDQTKLHVYSGAGIVEGSEADKEWQEIESKITHFTRLFKEEGQES